MGPKSVVLVTVDCLRADHVGFGGYGRPTTPFLDSLAKESFVFPAAIVAGAPTYYSFPAILASRPPLALGRDIIGLAPGETTLASSLKLAGYTTAAFSAANPYIASRFGYNQGFDVFRDLLAYGSLDSGVAANGNSGTSGQTRWNGLLYNASRRLKPATWLYDELYFQYCQRWALPTAQSLDSLRRFPAADVIVDQARSWLASVGQQPFFLWLHFMDPHAPYYPTQKALQMMGDGTLSPHRARYLNAFWLRHDLEPRRLRRHRDEVIALYDAGICWVDTQMACLSDALRRFGVWENCILAFTADHGEEFLDHGGRFHPPSGLMEEIIRVPLLLHVPQVAKKELPASAFSLMDLAPTLIAAADVQSAARCQGRSRWEQIQQGAGWDEPAIVECIAGCTNPFHPGQDRLGARVLAVRDARYKLVLEFDGGRERLYDLATDPREQNPLAVGAEKPVRGRLLQCAREHIEKIRLQRDPTAVMRARLSELRLEWAQPVNPSATAGF